MKVFMLGWEFPPVISGGLGTACYGLTKAMSHLGIDITFVLPTAALSDPPTHVKLRSAEGRLEISGTPSFENIQFKTIPSSLRPYASAGAVPVGRTGKKRPPAAFWQNTPGPEAHIYSGDLQEEVRRYAAKALEIASVEEFDIVHAHDWMTYPAGIAVAAAGGKPLVVHVHSTEFDRSGEHVNQAVYDIERRGMQTADKVIAVSRYMKNNVVSRYGVPPEKIEVIYNGVENNTQTLPSQIAASKSDKIVLFLGRITMQKGPEYFITAAKKVLDKMDTVKFIMAGDGDMTHRMIEYAAWLGIGHKVFFTRFLRGADVDRAFQMADLYVMPSVSEPFGIAPLEALRSGVPVLISKQSGVAETLSNVLKVDFWDVDQMANKIVAVLKHAPLHDMLRANGSAEVKKFRWDEAAEKVNHVYRQALAYAAV